MLKEILYDRIIDVTLYRRAKQIEALHAVHKSSGYSESVVNGKKVLRSYGGTDTVTTYDVRQQPSREENIPITPPMPDIIKFYEGDRRQIHAGIKQLEDGTIKDIYKTVKATGPIYTYRTMDEMKQGVKPNGRLLETGDRCRVIQNNTLWNVYVVGSEKSLLTEETIEADALTLQILCPRESLKPDVTFSIKLLPGQNCYGATLKIRNLNLGTIDIRSWDKMIITAGYRNGAKATFTCPIFSSYIESPNPDGVTVFEGLTVGSAENNFTDHLVTLHFLQEEMTLKDLIEGVAQGIMDDIQVANLVDDKIMSRTITMEKRTVYAQNGIAVLNWLRDTVNSFVDTITKGESTVFIQLAGHTLSVMIINGPSRQVEMLKNIINLDSVKGASFSGTALTVTAPWNPALNPGDLFFMPPEFINGSMLPNVLSLKDYRNINNLYRAITINVDFATVEEANQMTILAVPAQWAGELPDELATNIGNVEYSAAVEEWYKQGKSVEIDVGKKEPTEVKDLTAKTKEKTPEEKVKELYENNSSIIGKWDVWESVSLKSAPYVNCLSMASQYYIYEFSGGPKLEKGKAGYQEEGCYYETDNWLRANDLLEALKHQQDKGIGALSLWIPLIALGTYWKRDYDIKNGVNNDWATVDTENLNFLDFRSGHSLYVPAFPTGGWRNNRNRLTAFRDIWKEFYEVYKEGWPDLEGYALQWQAMYYYLGGT